MSFEPTRLVTCRRALLAGGVVVVAGASSCGAAAPGAPADAPPSPAAAEAAPMGQPMPGMMPPGVAPPPPPAAEAPAPALAARVAKDGLPGAAADKPAPPQWAPVRVFPVPNYAEAYDGPRNDFRETVYWAPSVRTDARGRAEVRFYLSDAVTSFRATAQGLGGGTPGRGEAVLSSKLPVSIAAKLPLEVTRGDHLRLPVTVGNATNRAQQISLSATFGPAFGTNDQGARKVTLAPKQKSTVLYELDVVGTAEGSGKVALSAQAGGSTDALARTVRVVPPGFEREEARSGTLERSAKETLDLPEWLPDTLDARLSFYPSPTATLVAGTDAMLREPTGCFEQASSANYPNVMVLGYLRENGKADAAVVARSEELLDHGYKRLVGYESKSKGYEWFGESPGHEALTAYGLMQFVDMQKVWKDVDGGMIQRTAAWLKTRRDGKGGFSRNAKSLDSFGAASEEVTNAYVTYALTEAGEKDLAPELVVTKKLARATKDPYLLALAAGTLVNLEPRGADTAPAVEKLEKLQGADGAWRGAAQSITRSGGVSLDVETTSLATLAIMRAEGDHGKAVAGALDWIGKQGQGGMYGSTQSTVLALKVLTRAAAASRTPAEGTITVRINGGAQRELKVGPDIKGALSVADLARDLKRGSNTVEIAAAGSMKLPYGLSVTYRALRPASSAKSAVSVTTSASAAALKNGEPLKLKAVVENVTAQGIPMVVARIGIPGGTTYQTWQLDELKQKGLVDYYETREREVIAYWRSMGPKASKTIELALLAQVPGTFTAPASSAYLYYTDEHKSFADPIRVTVNP